jgi:hypothetical protein
MSAVCVVPGVSMITPVAPKRRRVPTKSPARIGPCALRRPRNEAQAQSKPIEEDVTIMKALDYCGPGHDHR